jgi:hypothetical protein
MEKTANSNDTPGLLARIAHGARSLAARIDDGARTLVETSEETNARRAGMPRYSRSNPNPAWGDKRPGRADRIDGSQVVAPDSAPPPGERIALDEWTAGNIADDCTPNTTESNAIGADFFAARQAFADRRLR